MRAAFEHAFDWLGFGAKTAVGYGAMETPQMRAQREQEQTEHRRREQEEAAAREQERRQAEAEIWSGVRIKFNRANKALTVEKGGRSATAIAPRGEELLATLPADLRKKIETNQFVHVTAYVCGHDLLRVEP